MQHNSSFTEKESLSLISEMIQKAKGSYVTKGIAAMVWGSLIIFCSVVSWYEMAYRWQPGFDIWLLLFFALFPQIYFSIKEKRQRKFSTHNEHVINYVWIAFSLSIFITGFFNAKFGNSHSATPIMILYGIPTFIMGGITGFKPMVAGGLICWLFSIASIYTTPQTDMLLMAGCGLFAWLLPGIILWKRFKKLQRNNV